MQICQQQLAARGCLPVRPSLSPLSGLRLNVQNSPAVRKAFCKVSNRPWSLSSLAESGKNKTDPCPYNANSTLGNPARNSAVHASCPGPARGPAGLLGSVRSRGRDPSSYGPLSRQPGGLSGRRGKHFVPSSRLLLRLLGLLNAKIYENPEAALLRIQEREVSPRSLPWVWHGLL